MNVDSEFIKIVHAILIEPGSLLLSKGDLWLVAGAVEDPSLASQIFETNELLWGLSNLLPEGALISFHPRGFCSFGVWKFFLPTGKHFCLRPPLLQSRVTAYDTQTFILPA